MAYTSGYDPYGRSMQRDAKNRLDDPYRRAPDLYDDRDDPYSARLPETAYRGGEGPYPRGAGGGRDDPRQARDPYQGAPYQSAPYQGAHDDIIYSRPNKDRHSAAPNGLTAPRPPTDHNGMTPHKDNEMDHLATFTVGSKQGLLSPMDGIKKLRQMELNTGIWTMRVQLLIDNRDITIIDRTTGEEMERFPLNLVTDPTAVTNTDRRDVYNNVVLFTVVEDPYRRAPSEMHIFQSVGKPAGDIVDEIKAAKAGRLPDHGAAPRASNVSPRPMTDQIQQFEEAAQRAALATDAYKPGPQPGQMFRNSMRRDDNESVLSERTDRDVRARPHSNARDAADVDVIPNTKQLLNHCFDDIERFVGRLQHAAEAFKELDRRRKARDKRGQGDGMLSMRARPPPAKDFIDVFQKFKLSFNLLAKLKPHIHDPNAPELVHFLFTPLSLVVEASKDPRHGTPDIAAQVLAPLLSRDAKDLLINCLSSKEADLWHSLGESWRVPREDWKGYVAPYYPRFSDGWQVPMAWLTDINPQGSNGPLYDDERPAEGARGKPGPYGREPARDDRDPYDRNKEAHKRAMEEYEREIARREADRQRALDQQRDRDRQMTEDRERQEADRQRDYEQERHEAERLRELERDRRERDRREKELEEARLRELQQAASGGRGLSRDQESFLRELRARNARIYEVMHPREGRNPKELNLAKGDILEVLDDSRNWWKLRNNEGQIGHAPYTILQPFGQGEGTLEGASGGLLDNGPAEREPGPYHPSSPSALYRRSPSPPLGPSSSPPDRHGAPPVGREDLGRQASRRDEVDPANSAPYWRPEEAYQPGRDRPNRISAVGPDDLHDELNDELRQLLSLAGSVPSSSALPKRNPSVKPKTPSVFFNQHSDAEDVQDWLLAKGFSSSVRRGLVGKDGSDMFRFQRKALEDMFGREEGGRLDSQLTIQKSMAGYTVGRSAELSAVLRGRKEQVGDV